MTKDSVERLDSICEDHVATEKDLRILGLELKAEILNIKIEFDNKISSIILKLGSLIVACSGVLFGLLSYFQK